MKPAPSLPIRIAAALVAVTTLVGSASQAPPRGLRPLGGVEQVKAWFNANTSHVRAIVLLSPT